MVFGLTQAVAARKEAMKLEPSTYTVLRTSQPIAADGALNEPVWGRIEPVGPFLQYNGKPVTYETEAKLCWDDKYLYVAFFCIDPDIWGTYTKRDEPIYDQEVVEIFLNPACDLADYFEFQVSPRNVIWDGKIHNPDGRPGPNYRYDDKWNCQGLLTGVRVVGTVDDRTDVDECWTVEMAIPFASIDRKTPGDGERWRGNLYRIDRGEKDEYSCWSPTLREPPAFHIPSRFGWLVFSERQA